MVTAAPIISKSGFRFSLLEKVKLRLLASLLRLEDDLLWPKFLFLDVDSVFGEELEEFFWALGPRRRRGRVGESEKL